MVAILNIVPKRLFMKALCIRLFTTPILHTMNECPPVAQISRSASDWTATARARSASRKATMPSQQNKLSAEHFNSFCFYVKIKRYEVNAYRLTWSHTDAARFSEQYVAWLLSGTIRVKLIRVSLVIHRVPLVQKDYTKAGIKQVP